MDARGLDVDRACSAYPSCSRRLPGQRMTRSPKSRNMAVLRVHARGEVPDGFPPPGKWPPTPPDLLAWLNDSRREIIDEWVDRLSLMSPSYRARPRDELMETCTEAFEANLWALQTARLDRMIHFIDFITEKRLHSGFPLSDVQKAFELFRYAVVRRMQESGLKDLIGRSAESLNACLSFTLHRFSDHFQHMYRKEIVQYASNLEHEIAARTAELAGSERRYKTLVEEINDGYFVIQDERIAFANQAFCRMHGARLDEVLGRPFRDFVAPDCRERVFAAYQAALADRPFAGQLEYARSGCSPEEAATEIKSRVADLGQGPVLIGICRDISGRVAMEAKVREHERMAYVGHLTASLSHEIRNPLSAIKMNLQLLSRSLELDGYDQRRLEITVQQVSRLENILRQLLDTARPMTIDTAIVNLPWLARCCVDLLEPKATEKRVAIVERHAKNVPEIQGDGGKLEQAVINLLLNALEAVPEGGRIVVWSKASRSDGSRSVELGVSDNGPGIDPSHLHRIFTPFYTNKPRGTGLGLSNVRRIVEAHSGAIEVRSRKPKGTTFVMRLPC